MDTPKAKEIIFKFVVFSHKGDDLHEKQSIATDLLILGIESDKKLDTLVTDFSVTPNSTLSH